MMKGRPPKARPTPLATLEQKRDVYGFMVRPQHLERYREHATIYQEEEAERSDRWEQFLSTTADNVPPTPAPETHRRVDSSELEDSRVPAGSVQTSKDHEGEQGAGKVWGRLRESLRAIEQASIIKARDIRIVAAAAERIADSNNDGASKASSFSDRSGHRNSSSKSNDGSEGSVEASQVVDDGAVERDIASSGRKGGEASGEDSEDEFCDATESADELREGESNAPSLPALAEFPWEEELRSLVRGGVPMALRGELWQVFVGTKVRRLHGHYNALLTLLADGGDHGKGSQGLDGKGITTGDKLVNRTGVLEKWTNQIEKDLPRTFPGHPALDEDGRNTLRRLLTAYARHNPQVGYCQAMNFLAALLLLLMPEENAFWSLTGIIDDYFEGYYSEKMLEAQVDQLVFEDLVREKFPRLVGHLDALAVKVAWVSGPWFLSIFVNVLPWESVLRVWDVLLYEGNRCMLFRTGLALMEMHASALAGTRDAGDAVAMLQSMANDTFDSSQLVLTACMGFQTVTESKLQELRLKRRPEVLAALQERSTELHTWRNTNGSMAQKLPYLYRVESATGDSVLIKKSLIVSEENVDGVSNGLVNGAHTDEVNGDQQVGLSVEGIVSYEENSGGKQGVDAFSHREEDHAGADAREQVIWLKNELCRALEDKKGAVARAEELEIALVEIVKEDNRRLLAAKVEKLEAEVISLNQQLDDKKEQEQALVEILVRMEQEQKIADDARRFAEQDSTAQRRAAEVFQEKYEGAADALSEMEKRAVMAESMLEATLSYQALGNNFSPSSAQRPIDPRGARAMDPKGGSPLLKGTPPGVTSYQNGSGGTNVPAVDDNVSKQGIFNRPFGLNWRDRSKARTGSLDSPTQASVQAVAEPGPPMSPSCEPDRSMSMPLLEKDSVSADGKANGETLA